MTRSMVLAMIPGYPNTTTRRSELTGRCAVWLTIEQQASLAKGSCSFMANRASEPRVPIGTEAVARHRQPPTPS